MGCGASTQAKVQSPQHSYSEDRTAGDHVDDSVIPHKKPPKPMPEAFGNTGAEGEAPGGIKVAWFNGDSSQGEQTDETSQEDKSKLLLKHGVVQSPTGGTAVVSDLDGYEPEWSDAPVLHKAKLPAVAIAPSEKSATMQPKKMEEKKKPTYLRGDSDEDDEFDYTTKSRTHSETKMGGQGQGPRIGGGKGQGDGHRPEMGAREMDTEVAAMGGLLKQHPSTKHHHTNQSRFEGESGVQEPVPLYKENPDWLKDGEEDEEEFRLSHRDSPKSYHAGGMIGAGGGHGDMQGPPPPPPPSMPPPPPGPFSSARIGGNTPKGSQVNPHFQPSTSYPPLPGTHQQQHQSHQQAAADVLRVDDDELEFVTREVNDSRNTYGPESSAGESTFNLDSPDHSPNQPKSKLPIRSSSPVKYGSGMVAGGGGGMMAEETLRISSGGGGGMMRQDMSGGGVREDAQPEVSHMDQNPFSYPSPRKDSKYSEFEAEEPPPTFEEEEEEEGEPAKPDPWGDLQSQYTLNQSPRRKTPDFKQKRVGTAELREDGSIARVRSDTVSQIEGVGGDARGKKASSLVVSQPDDGGPPRGAQVGTLGDHDDDSAGYWEDQHMAGGGGGAGAGGYQHMNSGHMDMEDVDDFEIDYDIGDLPQPVVMNAADRRFSHQTNSNSQGEMEELGDAYGNDFEDELQEVEWELQQAQGKLNKVKSEKEYNEFIPNDDFQLDSPDMTPATRLKNVIDPGDDYDEPLELDYHRDSNFSVEELVLTHNSTGKF